MSGIKLQFRVMLSILCVFVTFLNADAQGDPASKLQITLTPVVFPPPQFGEPELICPYFREIQPGYTWNGITIGVSSQVDLENSLEELGKYETVLPIEGTLANSIGYRWQESREQGVLQQAPAQIDACFQDGKIMVLDMTWYYQSPFYINDLVAIHGEPDVVTWSITENLRIAFWFELGTVAEVFVQRGDAASFGILTRAIYFQPQSSEGYERRWPFSVTRAQPFYPVDPSIASEQNPFDFDAMIATITAEPSRTPTPTFAPISSIPTATP